MKGHVILAGSAARRADEAIAKELARSIATARTPRHLRAGQRRGLRDPSNSHRLGALFAELHEIRCRGRWQIHKQVDGLPSFACIRADS